MREIKDRAEFGALLNEMGLTGYAAEIGVYLGEFSKQLLDTWQGKQLFLVDPWEKMDDYANDPINDGDRTADSAACRELLRGHINRYTILQRTSREAAQHFADDSLDFIYLDANHNDPFPHEDLRLWYPKLKHGGIFAGHDYLSTVTWPGVQREWNAFAAEIGVTLNLTWETGGSAWFVKS